MHVAEAEAWSERRGGRTGGEEMETGAGSREPGAGSGADESFGFFYFTVCDSLHHINGGQ